MKRLVFTSASADMTIMLAEWVVSLRTLARFTGEILVLDYGLNDTVVRALDAWSVRTIKCIDRGCIVCTRYIDAAEVLVRDYSSHLAAHFDADIWFQRSLDGLFELAQRHVEGCVFAPDVKWFTQPFHGIPDNAVAYAAKVQEIRRRFGGTIQGGMSCGPALNLARRYSEFADMIRDGRLKQEYGADQFALNWLFNFEKDSAEGHLWNCIGADTVLDEGVWHSTRTHSKHPAAAIHVVGMLRNETTRLFRNLHTQTLICELAGIGLSSDPALMLNGWGVEADAAPALALAAVIITCRKHRGSAIAVGMPAPRAVFGDIGCTSMVLLSHGNAHYWDRLGLPRRPHIQHPNKLYLSAKAVQVLAEAKLEEIWELCQMFEQNWFDFMLTMLCAQRSLSWGLIV